MESVLHIEPIIRQTNAPINIGHTDYIFYGEKLTEDGENIGNTTSNISLGCPLESPDYGSTRSHIPLVKTIEYVPDFSRDKGHVYSETLHYVKDGKYLIPFRSKIRSGLGQGLRITHLPSLNMIREDLTGLSHSVIDPRAEIVSDVLLRDQIFQKRQNPALRDWISDDLTTLLALKPTNELSFDTADITAMIYRYINEIHHTPSEFTERNLKDIITTIAPSHSLIPSKYNSDEGICTHISRFKPMLMDAGISFKSLGRIPIEKVNRIDYNSNDFKEICEAVDKVPLTDFNVDMVVTPDSNISFYHEHVALDRFGLFDDNDVGVYAPENIVRFYIDGPTLNRVLEKFIHFHSGMTEEIEDAICHNAVKIKLIKTLSDEAAVLLYRYDSGPNDPPLCGVYFDIALQSLAPLSIMREPCSY